MTGGPPKRPHGRRWAGALVALLTGIALVWLGAQDRPALAEGPPAGFARSDPAPLPDAQTVVDQAERLFDPARLRDLYIEFETSAWQNLLARNLSRGRNLDALARLSVDGQVFERIGVRYKGNTSLSVEGIKKPFNLSIDAFEPGQRLLGYDVLNLNNGWGDPSMLREAVAYQGLRAYMPVPQASFARVFVNERYLGVYLMVEQIEATFLETWFPDPSGHLIKADNPADTELESSTLKYSSSLDSYRRGYEPKGAGDPVAALETLQALTRALDAPSRLGGLADSEFEAGIREHLDVDSALWYLAANNALVNYDSYYAGHNYFLYRNRLAPRFHMLNWDWNLSFGTFQSWFGEFLGGGGSKAPIPETPPYDQRELRDRPLTRRLLAVDAYRADYAAYLRTLRDRVLEPERLEASALAFQHQIRNAVAAETDPIYSTAEFERNLHSEVRRQRRVGPNFETEIIPGLLSTATARHAFLSDPERNPDLVSPRIRLGSQGIRPARPLHDRAVMIGAGFEGEDAPASVELRYRVDGGRQIRLAMQAGQDGAWQVEIPAQAAGSTVDYVFRTALADGRVAFFPEATLTAPYRYRVAGVDLPLRPGGPLVINELLADNQQGARDEAGEFEDWVEILNRGDAPLSLEGYFLSDRADLPWAYPLPPVLLPPGGRWLAFCDRAPQEGPNHAPFRLARSGETLVLARREALVDRVDFGALAADQSWGRTLDGAENWAHCDRATPLGANDCRARGWRNFMPRLAR
jgi:hypothetical protein